MKLRRREEREQIRTATDKMKHCLISSREIFYVTVVLCLNILWLKAVSEITASHKCCIEYLTTDVELVFPTFKSGAVHKII